MKSIFQQKNVLNNKTLITGIIFIVSFIYLYKECSTKNISKVSLGKITNVKRAIILFNSQFGFISESRVLISDMTSWT